MTNARVRDSTDRTALEDEALARIAGRAPPSHRRRLTWLEAIGILLWLCVGMMVIFVVASAPA